MNVYRTWSFCLANKIIHKERIIAREKGWNALGCTDIQTGQLLRLLIQRLFTIPHIAHGGAQCAHAQTVCTLHTYWTESRTQFAYTLRSHEQFDNWSPLVSVFMRTKTFSLDNANAFWKQLLSPAKSTASTIKKKMWFGRSVFFLGII